MEAHDVRIRTYLLSERSYSLRAERGLASNLVQAARWTLR